MVMEMVTIHYLKIRTGKLVLWQLHPCAIPITCVLVFSYFWYWLELSESLGQLAVCLKLCKLRSNNMYDETSHTKCC